MSGSHVSQGRLIKLMASRPTEEEEYQKHEPITNENDWLYMVDHDNNVRKVMEPKYLYSVWHHGQPLKAHKPNKERIKTEHQVLINGSLASHRPIRCRWWGEFVEIEMVNDSLSVPRVSLWSLH